MDLTGEPSLPGFDVYEAMALLQYTARARFDVDSPPTDTNWYRKLKDPNESR
jgi:hypothetical protein